MAKVKGSAFKASIQYLKEKLENITFEEFIEKVPPEVQKLLETPILTSSWYEFSLLIKLMDSAEPHLHPEKGRSVAWDMGRFSADVGLSTVYRIFFKVADPSYIIKKASQVYQTYYSSGEMTCEEIGAGKALLCLREVDQPDIHLCERLLGWMERTLELSGAKKVTMSHPKCRTRGDDRCEFHGIWE